MAYIYWKHFTNKMDRKLPGGILKQSECSGKELCKVNIYY